MLLDVVLRSLAFGFATGASFLVFSGYFRIALQPIIILAAIIAVHMYGDKDLIFLVDASTVLCYTLVLVLFLAIALLAKKKNYKKAAQWNRLWMLLLPFSGLKDQSRYFMAMDHFQNLETEEGKALLKKNVADKIYNYRILRLCSISLSKITIG